MTKLAALMLVAVTACASSEPDEGPRVCTMIGCSNGLSIVVNSTVQQDLTVTVLSGEQTLHSFTCRAGQPCQTFLENQTPMNVTVRVTSSAGTVSREYAPEYRMNRPNGPDCPPECRQATVTMAVS
jgi:hypothetical protein